MHFIKIIIVISLFLSPFTSLARSTNTFNVAVEVNDQIITNYEISQRIIMLETFGAKSVSKKEVINSLINERLYTYSAIELEALPNNSEINKGLDDLVFIEVQHGSYFGEDDIVRIEDDYNRE